MNDSNFMIWIKRFFRIGDSNTKSIKKSHMDLFFTGEDYFNKGFKY